MNVKTMIQFYSESHSYYYYPIIGQNEQQFKISRMEGKTLSYMRDNFS